MSEERNTTFCETSENYYLSPAHWGRKEPTMQTDSLLLQSSSDPYDSSKPDCLANSKGQQYSKRKQK